MTFRLPALAAAAAAAAAVGFATPALADVTPTKATLIPTRHESALTVIDSSHALRMGEKAALSSRGTALVPAQASREVTASWRDSGTKPVLWRAPRAESDRVQPLLARPDSCACPATAREGPC